MCVISVEHIVAGSSYCYGCARRHFYTRRLDLVFRRGCLLLFHLLLRYACNHSCARI